MLPGTMSPEAVGAPVPGETDRPARSAPSPGISTAGRAAARRPLRKAPHRLVAGTLPPLLLVAALLLVWQAAATFGQPRPGLAPGLAPGPLDVAAAFGAAWSAGQIQLGVATSLSRGVLGFLLAVAIGTPLGLLLAEMRFVRRALGPLISGLQVLPSVAWVPAAILWFGVSDATVYFVVLIGAIPSIANGLVSGFDQVPPQLRRVGAVLGASRLQQARLVVLPAALPGYLAGLKQGWAFSWRSLMAAEIIATGGSLGFGLGSLLQQSRLHADLPGVLVTIIVILALGILVELLVFAPIERRLLRGRGLLAAGGR